MSSPCLGVHTCGAGRRQCGWSLSCQLLLWGGTFSPEMQRGERMEVRTPRGPERCEARAKICQTTSPRASRAGSRGGGRVRAGRGQTGRALSAFCQPQTRPSCLTLLSRPQSLPDSVLSPHQGSPGPTGEPGPSGPPGKRVRSPESMSRLPPPRVVGPSPPCPAWARALRAAPTPETEFSASHHVSDPRPARSTPLPLLEAAKC